LHKINKWTSVESRASNGSTSRVVRSSILHWVERARIVRVVLKETNHLSNIVGKHPASRSLLFLRRTHWGAEQRRSIFSQPASPGSMRIWRSNPLFVKSARIQLAWEFLHVYWHADIPSLPITSPTSEIYQNMK
jgi:hypothetical protein